MDCINWHLFIDKHGYGIAHVGKRTVFAHRLAYCNDRKIRLEDIDGKVIMHTCDNPACVNPEHLKEGSQRENMEDMAEKNRSCIGEKNPRATLSVNQCIEIVRDYEPYKKGLVKIMAEKYGVSERNIRKVATGERWNKALQAAPKPGDV